MARGKSGRIVIEIDPKLKRELYLALERKGLTLKDWFVKQAETYIKDQDQLPIFWVNDEGENYDKED